MALVQLARGLAGGTVNHPTALHGRPLQQSVSPALDVLIVLHAEELSGSVGPTFDQSSVPRENGHVGNRVGASCDVLAIGQTPVEYIQLALHLHGKPIDGIFDLRRGIGVKMPESAAEVRCAAHLPEQPRQAFGACSSLHRQELPELLGEIDQDRTRLEYAHRRWLTAVEQRRNLGVGVYRHETAAELIAVTDFDQPRVVLRALMTE